VAEAIKADAEVSRVRLMMLTSYGNRGSNERARKAGVSIYLTKPVRQSQLLECVATASTEFPQPTATTVATSIKSAAPSVQERCETSPKDAELKAGKRILLAEDSVVNQRIAVRQLQKLGYRVDAVANGKEVLEATEQISYDLILMDCQMPEMDGYEATRSIRNREGQTKHTPVIALTAHATAGARDECLSAGMDDYITKPVKREDLESALARWLFLNSDKCSTGNDMAHPQVPVSDRSGVV
jgi:CheY-like chemotaxis protein